MGGHAACVQECSELFPLGAGLSRYSSLELLSFHPRKSIVGCGGAKAVRLPEDCVIPSNKDVYDLAVEDINERAEG